MTRILGIDPGSQITGYGLIEARPGRSRALLSGTLRPRRGLSLPDRLHAIHKDLTAILAEHEPDVVAVETAFYHKSARSALVLGHVRGVVLLAACEAGASVQEYAPREIKLAVTGSGAATKDRVAYMVRAILDLPDLPPPDAADALATALCHWHRSGLGTAR